VSLLGQALGEGAVRIGVKATDWEAAVRIAGAALVASGRVTDAYTDDMVQIIRELGPYPVIAPGLAMPHARPSEAVLSTGMSLILLEEPVSFGHSKNDPVRVVFGLAALDHDRHLDLLSEFAGRFADPTFVNSLLSCKDETEIRGLLS
jgi:PTS system ascorbate-specific IIA component